MKKVTVFALSLAGVLALALFAGCGGGGGSSSNSPYSPSTPQDTYTGTGKFTSGPDAGDPITLTITNPDAGGTSTTSSSTGGTTTGTGTTGGTVTSAPLTGNMIIAGTTGFKRETIQLSGSISGPSGTSGIFLAPTVSNIQLTGTAPSSTTTYTVTGQTADTFTLKFGATITTSTGDSGTVNVD